MTLITPLDPGELAPVIPMTVGCHAAWATSFSIGARVFTVTFEANRTDNDEYAPFCHEQNLRCSELFIMKFDHALNVRPEDAFKRMPSSYRLGPHELAQLARLLAGGLERCLRDFDPMALVGVPNDQKLADWYAIPSKRTHFPGRLIGMRSSAHHLHEIIMVWKA